MATELLSSALFALDLGKWSSEAKLSVQAMMTNPRAQVEIAIKQNRAKQEQEWHTWAAEAVQGGAGKAHAFTKQAVGWQPTLVKDEEGHLSGDPRRILQSLTDQWQHVWGTLSEHQASRPGVAKWVQDVAGGIPDMSKPISTDLLRTLSGTYAPKSASGLDGFHMRHFKELPEQALQSLAQMYQVFEQRALLPKQVWGTIMAQLAKPAGGYRPIGVASSFYRLWGKSKRAELEAWEQSVMDDYFAAASNRSVTDPVWRAAARAEEGVTKGLCAANVLWDISKFYENLPHDLVARLGLEHSFPLQVLRGALCFYRCPRYVAMGGAALRQLYAARGVVAGCSVATYVTKLVCQLSEGVQVLACRRSPRHVYRRLATERGR